MSATANIVSHGPLLKCKCPGCKENQEFHLTEKTTQSSLLKKMMLIGDREEWNLVCQSCDYHHKVPKPEGSAVLHALMPLKEENTPENLQKKVKKKKKKKKRKMLGSQRKLMPRSNSVRRIQKSWSRQLF